MFYNKTSNKSNTVKLSSKSILKIQDDKLYLDIFKSYVKFNNIYSLRKEDIKNVVIKKTRDNKYYLHFLTISTVQDNSR